LIRWLTVVVGVGVAAAALYALLSAPGTTRARRPAPPPVAAPAASAPLGDIDDESRARLEQVLREADRDEGAR